MFLAKVDAEDTELQMEMFLVDEKGSIKSRSTRIGDKLYGFGIDAQIAKYIRLLAERDYAIPPAEGKIGVAGRVVDKQTFLFGREGVQVGLYSKE